MFDVLLVIPFWCAFSYADDLTLIAPCISAAQKMLHVCEEYAEEYNVLFNSIQSCHLLYNTKCLRNVSLTLNGKALQTCKSAVHLGTVIGLNSHEVNVEKAINDLIHRTNVLMSKYSFCSSDVRVHLFLSFCSSYYGSSLWKLDTNSLLRLSVAWRKCVRRLLKVQYTTHSRYLPLIINKPDISIELLGRFNTFWSSCIDSPHKYVRFVTKMIHGSRSIVSDNLKVVLSYLNMEYGDYAMLVQNRNVSKNVMIAKYKDKCNVEDIHACNVIKELLRYRDGQVYIPLTKEEGNVLLTHLCIN